MVNTTGGLKGSLAVAVIAVLLSSCTVLDVAKLAGDETAGRDNATPGSALARQYLLQQLKPIAVGADPAHTGDDAFLQPFQNGTNVVAVIRGTDLADQYVMVGAHYDHLGSSCRTADPNDTICNGATDNAAGVAAVLAIGRSIAAQADASSALHHPGPVGQRGGRARGLHVLHPTPAHPAGQDRRLRQLRHPGRQPVAQPAQHEFRHRRRERRCSASAGSAIGDLPTDPRRHDVQLHLRAGPQRLRAVPRAHGCRASSSATPPAPVITRLRTRSASSTSRSSISRSPSLFGSFATLPRPTPTPRSSVGRPSPPSTTR